MSPAFPPLFMQIPARMLVAVLCALLAVASAEGKHYDTQSSGSSATSTSPTHQKPGSASKKKSSASSTASRKPASSTAGKTRKHRSATAPRGKKKYVSPAERRRRAARAHKIKLAFVASNELRPMAQQLSTLRTPAAFSGVTSYAHSHSGQ